MVTDLDGCSWRGNGSGHGTWHGYRAPGWQVGSGPSRPRFGGSASSIITQLMPRKGPRCLQEAK